MNPHTYITIEDASTLLDKQYVTVKAASSRGVFTRVPVTSHQQCLVKEQVELFKSKKQLKLASLSKDELRKWHEINDSITVPEAPSHSAETEEEKQIRNQLSQLPKLKGMNQTITIKYEPTDEKEVSQGGVPFSDREAVRDTSNSLSMDEFLKTYTPGNIGGLLLLGGLLLIGGYLLFKAIKSLPENPSEEEIEEVVSDIPDEAQRENAKILLFDPHMREALRELAKAS